MQIIYSGEHVDLKYPSRSIFLAGPTARKGQTLTWRQDAINYFGDITQHVSLIVPELRDGAMREDYNHVIEWEHRYLHLCKCILFWVPWSIENKIYGFTTNVEFGYWMATDANKVFYGRPNDSDNNRYLDSMYRANKDQEPFTDLEQLVQKTYDYVFWK
jgi:hypothetical protein